MEASSQEAANAEDNDTQSLPLTGHAYEDGENDDDGTDKVPKKRTAKAKNNATKKKKGLGKGKYISSILLIFNNIKYKQE